MHMRGHKDEDCKKKYDANNDHDLDGVNTQIAKQTFSKTNLFRNVKSINETFYSGPAAVNKAKKFCLCKLCNNQFLFVAKKSEEPK